MAEDYSNSTAAVGYCIAGQGVEACVPHGGMFIHGKKQPCLWSNTKRCLCWQQNVHFKHVSIDWRKTNLLLRVKKQCCLLPNTKCRLWWQQNDNFKHLIVDWWKDGCSQVGNAKNSANERTNKKLNSMIIFGLSLGTGHLWDLSKTSILTLCIPTNLWKFELNWSSSLQENNERKNTLVTQICMRSYA